MEQRARADSESDPIFPFTMLRLRGRRTFAVRQARARLSYKDLEDFVCSVTYDQGRKIRLGVLAGDRVHDGRPAGPRRSRGLHVERRNAHGRASTQPAQ
jgi:hypothetical protein